MLNLDFEEEITKILELIPKERKTFLFSATMTSKVDKLQRASLMNPVRVEVNTKYVSTFLSIYLVGNLYGSLYLISILFIMLSYVL